MPSILMNVPALLGLCEKWDNHSNNNREQRKQSKKRKNLLKSWKLVFAFWWRVAGMMV